MCSTSSGNSSGYLMRDHAMWYLMFVYPVMMHMVAFTCNYLSVDQILHLLWSVKDKNFKLLWMLLRFLWTFWWSIMVKYFVLSLLEALRLNFFARVILLYFTLTWFIISDKISYTWQGSVLMENVVKVAMVSRRLLLEEPEHVWMLVSHSWFGHKVFCIVITYS